MPPMNLKIEPLGDQALLIRLQDEATAVRFSKADSADNLQVGSKMLFQRIPQSESISIVL